MSAVDALREKRVEEAAKLYLQGNTYRKIGEIMGLPKSTVLDYINIAREMWRDDSIHSIELHKRQEIARLDDLISEYWQGYQRSIGTVQKRVREKKVVPKSSKTVGEDGQLYEGGVLETIHAKVYEEDRAGDPRFLDGIARCMQLRSRILGIEEPLKTENKHDHTGLDFDAVIKIVQASHASDDAQSDDGGASTGDSQMC